MDTIWIKKSLRPAKTSLILAFPLLFLLTFVSCGKNNDCEREYLYEIPFTVTANDTLKTNDTIWLESKLPLQLIDLNEGQTLSLEDIDFGIEVLFGKLDSTRQDVGYLFDAFVTDGSVTPRSL